MQGTVMQTIADDSRRFLRGNDGFFIVCRRLRDVGRLRNQEDTEMHHARPQPHTPTIFALGWSLCLAVLTPAATTDAAIATFEDLKLPRESYWNGADGSGGFASGGVRFKNTYVAGWEYWEGFAYSNITDTQTGGLEGQYNAIPGSGQGRSATYGVGYVGWLEPTTMTLSRPQTLQGLYVTNDNFTYYAILNSSGPAQKFGRDSGDVPDWLKLTVIGKDAAGDTTGKVDFYLADFRFADNSQDYVVNSWRFVDLTSLGEVKTLQFTVDSSDTGEFGINTPGYFCIDTVVPEPATALLLGLGTLVAIRRRRPHRPGSGEQSW
jgi:hypothetical protein